MQDPEEEIFSNALAPPSSPEGIDLHITSLDPIALLMDELKHENCAIRVNAINHLGAIADQLGPERTASELLPFLERAEEEEDEVLIAMAIQIPLLVSRVPRGELLLGPLQRLVGEEDVGVREKALESFCAVAKLVEKQGLETLVFPLIAEFAVHEWFPRRQSAAIIAISTWPLFQGLDVASACLDKIFDLILQLLHDTLPMVRRVVVKQLADLIPLLGPDQLSVVAEHVAQIVRDPIDSVRLFVPHILVAVASRDGGRGRAMEEFVQLVPEVLEDQSWRIKYVVAERYPELWPFFTLDCGLEVQHYASSFAKLLTDVEAEVRYSATLRLHTTIDRIIHSNDADNIKIFTNLFHTLALNQAPQVKLAFAQTFPLVLAKIPDDRGVSSELLEIYLAMLQNQASSPEVRLALISQLDLLGSVFGVQALVQAMLPALSRLSQDRGWRVRKALVQYIPSIARHFGHEFYEASLAPLMASLLGDHYFAVREAAIEALKMLVGVFGPQWALNALFSAAGAGTIKGLSASSNYLFRETALMAIERIIPLLDSESDIGGRGRLVALGLELLGDRIPNVRLVACSTLGKIASVLEQGSRQEIQGLLESVSVRDEDEDVKRYAREALVSISKI